MTDTSTAPGDHASCSELLPWYVNGTLQAHETAMVEAHLRECDECGEQLTSLRSISATVQAQPAGPSFASDDRLAALLAEIEAPLPTPAARAVPLRERVLAWWQASRPVPNWAMASVAALVVGLGGVLVMPGGGDEAGDEYQTLSSAPPARTSVAASLQVVFDEATTVGALRDLLQSIDATIVSGPSSVGAYRLALREGASVDDARDLLAAHPSVRFVGSSDR